jgi:xylulokinase
VRSLFLGVDVSTTGAKALLVDEKGAVVASATTPLGLQTPKPLWSEQDPQEWWEGTAKSIRQALATAKITAREVAAVGLTGQMHGLVLLDAESRVLRPAILWNDQRTGAECDEIRSRLGGREALVKATGNDALTGFTAPKILWVRKHEPEVYARAALVLLPKDYIRLRLTGVAAMDKADGSGTLLFDLPSRDWSAHVLERLDIPRAWLPPTFEGPQATGTVSAQAAEATGLRAGTPVMAGGGDQAAGAVGAGAVEPGVVSMTLGTSGVIFASTKQPLYEPQGRLHAFCHAVPGTWHFMGVTLAAAGSLQWYRDTLAPGESFDALVAEAEAVPPGSEGLLFLPYLSGERTPYPDPLARGSFAGLTLRHTAGSGPGLRFGGPGRGRRGQEPALAPYLRERARGRARFREQHRRRGLRGGPLGGGGRGRLPERGRGLPGRDLDHRAHAARLGRPGRLRPPPSPVSRPLPRAQARFRRPGCGRLT